MTIEGLGKKFQEARRARDLTLDEAARMTKIRPARLAEIEADDFSQFPSLAYAKGFLLIYGKFLDVDVTPYLDTFEDSEQQHSRQRQRDHRQQSIAPAVTDSHGHAVGEVTADASADAWRQMLGFMAIPV